ncbi:unnamed protein product [Sympodiomycopsis kandeliae]
MMVKTKIASALLLSINLAALPALADVTVSNPLASQLPLVAHVGTEYSWSFSDTTFNSTTGPATYTATGLPKWATFDANSRTFSGTPSKDDVESSSVTIHAEDGGESAQDTFELPVVADPAPTLKKPLTDQLAMASSLGRSQILAGNKLHIPYGWSFSVGWQGDTFTLDSGARVFTKGTIQGTKALPSWLKYSPTTYAMWGIAPNVPPPEGTEFVFTMTGSNVENHGGTQTNITIVLGEGNLAVPKNAFAPIVADAGSDVNYTLPLSQITYDGRPVVDVNTLDVQIDTSSANWLQYDSTRHVLSGQTPQADASTTEPIKSSVPVTVKDSLGKVLRTTVDVVVYPPFFSNAILPNIFVTPGQEFNVSLSEFIRNSDAANITAEYDPPEAGEWISYNSSTTTLGGMPPNMNAADKVQITLRSAASSGSSAQNATSSNPMGKRADDSDGPSNEARLFVALNGTNPGKPSSPKGNHGGGLSQRSRTIIGAVLGSVGGFILLIALLMLMRRCCAVEDHDTQGNTIDDTRSPAMSDDRTLYGDQSPAMGGAYAYKKNKIKEGASPLPEYNQYLHPKSAEQRADHQKNGSELRGILIGGRNYGGNTPEMTEDEKPRQHGFMSAIVAGARKKFPSNRSLAKEATRQHSTAPSESAGLGLTGLGLEAPESDDPYTRRPAGHSRSQFSLRSSNSRESWEDDLFYQQQTLNDGAADFKKPSLTPVIEVDEVPVRRGSTRISSRSSRNNPMRQRSAHINASPAFAAPASFANPASDESSHGHTTSSHGHGHKDSVTEMPSNVSEPFVIGTAQRVDMRSMPNGSVTSHQPDIRQQHHRSISSHATTYDQNAAFEDAEDEEQVSDHQSRDAARNSTMSSMTTDSQVRAMQPYISYPDQEASAAASPRPPSFLGGASISSSVRPEETLRAVKPPSFAPVPPMPSVSSHRHRPNFSQSSIRSNPNTPGRSAPRPSRAVESLEANVLPGEWVRIKMSPPGGPAMIGGAPGSPGKRSSRMGRYVPVLDDETMQANGTWPIWLSEWLHWDPAMFELSGEVPLDFELSPVRIALVHRRQSEPASPALGSSPTRSHSRQHSQESSTTAVDDEIVVRLTLWIEPSEMPYDEGQIHLRREGTGTAF